VSASEKNWNMVLFGYPVEPFWFVQPTSQYML